MLQQLRHGTENAAQSPREAGRRVRQMLTMLKPTVVTDSAPTGLEVEWEERPSVDRRPAPDALPSMTHGGGKILPSPAHAHGLDA